MKAGKVMIVWQMKTWSEVNEILKNEARILFRTVTKEGTTYFSKVLQDKQPLRLYNIA